MIDGNKFWKDVAMGTGTALQNVTKTIDIALAIQSATTDPAALEKYFLLSQLPDSWGTAYSIVDQSGQLALTLAANGNPTIPLIEINSLIWGKLVAPQLIEFAVDPFDPDYQQPVVVTGFPNPGVLTSDTAIDVVLGQSYANATAAAVYLQAANTAFNRYCSALEMSDSISAGMQLESLLYYMNLYRDKMANSATDLANIRTLLADAGIADTAYDPQILQDLQTQVLADGLSQSTLDLLEGLGLSQADIDHMTQQLLTLNPDSFSGSLYSALGDANNALNGIPEPASLAMLALGGGMLLVRRRNGAA
ncbi:MAG: PEP-CTERM sorting domain-containing protein [Phycisphaeraceae bacterium]